MSNSQNAQNCALYVEFKKYIGTKNSLKNHEKNLPLKIALYM